MKNNENYSTFLHIRKNIHDMVHILTSYLFLNQMRTRSRVRTSSRKIVPKNMCVIFIVLVRKLRTNRAKLFEVRIPGYYK